MSKALEKRFYDFIGNQELYNRLHQTFDKNDALKAIEYYKKLDESFGHKYEDSRYQELYDTLIQQNRHSDLENWLDEIILKAKQNYHSIVQSDILIKLFPSGSLNAQINAYDEGYLILINECARELFFDLYGILLRYKVFQQKILKDKQKETFEKKEFIGKWSTVLCNYIATGTYSSNFHDYAIAGNHNSLFQGFVNDTEYFIIAHEYAHALLGHVQSSQKNLLSYHSPVGQIEVCQKNWKMEYEADIIGIGIILEKEPTVFNMIAITSCITLFLIEDLLSQINHKLKRNQLTYPILTDHPPASNRINMILGYVNQKVLLEKKYLKIIDTVQEICLDCKDQIIETVVKKL